MQHKFNTTNIKGKEYVQVNDRILYFRNEPKFNGWSLESEVLSLDSESCVVRATIRNEAGSIVAQGLAQEDKSSSYINKTSYVENCETSAWGRALANLGIGIETSIASSNEVSMAVAKQSLSEQPKVADTAKKRPLNADIIKVMKEAVKDGKKAEVEKALIQKYECTAEQKKEILG